MSEPTYHLSKLAPEIDLGTFDCGELTYNQWLVEHASQAVSAGTSMVYLLMETRPSEKERVIGYFAICPTLVVRDDMPKPLQRKVLRSAPGWLLAKLALDQSLRGDPTNRWGWQLLRAALETIVAASNVGGGQVIVVDADNPGLVDWSIRHGFTPASRENLRLCMKVATASKYLGQTD